MYILSINISLSASYVYIFLCYFSVYCQSVSFILNVYIFILFLCMSVCVSYICILFLYNVSANLPFVHSHSLFAICILFLNCFSIIMSASISLFWMYILSQSVCQSVCLLVKTFPTVSRSLWGGMPLTRCLSYAACVCVWRRTLCTLHSIPFLQMSEDCQSFGYQDTRQMVMIALFVNLSCACITSFLFLALKKGMLEYRRVHKERKADTDRERVERDRYWQRKRHTGKEKWGGVEE